MHNDDFDNAPEETPPPRSMRNAVSLDVVTEAGRFTLMVDPTQPAYIFVLIEGDWRKCLYLEDAPERLPNKDAAAKYLLEFSRSSMFMALVSEEQHLHDEWDAL